MFSSKVKQKFKNYHVSTKVFKHFSGKRSQQPSCSVQIACVSECFVRGTLTILVDTCRLSVKNLLLVFEMILYRTIGFFINIAACSYLQYGHPAKHRWQMLRREFGILGKIEVIDKHPLQLWLSN